jgi:signal recognition particle receptor subunit beta
MALVNQAKHEINAKVVYFGPGLAGKATNLKHVYGKLKPDFRGQMKAMNVQSGRMLFFDFTPPGDGNVEGFRVRFHIYTVSGEAVDAAAWKMVLKGVDGIVFVADAASERRAENQQSLETLSAILKGYGQSLSSVPVAFQYNKSDLSDALQVTELERTLNPAGFPSFKASSQSGEGVLQTLLSLVKNVLTGLRAKGIEGIASAESVQRVVQEPALQAPAAEVRTEEPPEYQATPAPREAAPQERPAQAAAPEPLFAASEEPAPAAGEGAAVPAAGEEEPLSLEFAGTPEPVGHGLFRLPLTIKSGARSKKVVLSVALSIEEE